MLTEVRPSEEPLCSGEKMIVLKENYVSSLAVIHKLILSCKPFLKEGAIIPLQQVHEGEFLSLLKQQLPLLFATTLYSLSAHQAAAFSL